jgi:beta-lactam-binding protein with PASTA domain
VRIGLVSVVLLACLTLLGCTPTIPDVRNKPVLDGVTQLSLAGLNLGDVSYDPNSSALYQTIVSQSPAPGSAASSGQLVDVVLSGTQPVPYPLDDGFGPPRINPQHPSERGVSISF